LSHLRSIVVEITRRVVANDRAADVHPSSERRSATQRVIRIRLYRRFREVAMRALLTH
jgi:hypothetical protein